jgi:hypothetical protein
MDVASSIGVLGDSGISFSETVSWLALAISMGYSSVPAESALPGCTAINLDDDSDKKPGRTHDKNYQK